MAGSSLNDWNLNPDPETLNYHLKQQAEPYRSTVHFVDFIADRLEVSESVIDLCCGAGGPTWYLADRFPATKFLGLDESEELIGRARRARNLDFAIDHADNLQVRFGVDGVVLLQALHTMPDPQLVLHQVATRIRPQWIAFSTLIYEGNINCKIIVGEPERPRKSYYNVYGLPMLTGVMSQEGYAPLRYRPFYIDVDLPKPDNPDLMGTYTLALESGGRLQCSGPLLMPWGFAVFERRHADTH